MLIKRIGAFFIAVWSIFMSFFGIEVPLGEKSENFRVTSYVVAEYVQSENAFCPEDFDIITDAILFGCARFDENGNVTTDEKLLTTALNNLRKAIGDRDVNITLNLLGPQQYGDSSVYEEQMAYQAALHTKAFESGVLEENIRDIILEYGFDGVHFDYEYPISKKAWTAFNKFLVSLKKEMPDRLLGVAVSDWDLRLNTKAMDAVDTIELMLYDNYDAEGRHAPYDVCTSYARNTALKELPLEKVNFGLPFYARPTDRGAYWYSYNAYYDKLDSNAYYHDSTINKDFWFNTKDVIGEKTEFAINNGFGGVMIWHYSCDLPSTNENSLLAAVSDAVKTK